MKITDIECKTKYQKNIVEQLEEQTKSVLKTKWNSSRDAYDYIFVECDVLFDTDIYSDTAFYDSVREYQRALFSSI